MKSERVTALLVAAGLSGRMNSFKPLLEINGKSFLQLITEKLLIICDEVIIVTGFKHNEIVDELKRKNLIDNKCKIVYNENYKNGMFSSLKSGLGYIDSKWILYHFIDQPTLSDKFYTEFVSQISNSHDWIQPVNKGRKGHPLLFNNFVANLIKSINDSSTLRDISQNPDIRKLIWECDYKEILVDIDHPEDYKKLSSDKNKGEV